MSGWMSSYTLHMCLLPWLRTVKGRGGRHNGAGLLLLLHSVERKSTSNTNGWMDYYKSKSSLIAIENDFILHLHLLKYFFCIFNSVFFYISIDPLRRLPAISSFHGRPPWMEGVGGRVGADCRAAGRGQRPRRCRHLVRSLVRSFVHDVAPLVAVEDWGLTPVVLAPLLVEDIVFIIVIAWMSQQI